MGLRPGSSHRQNAALHAGERVRSAATALHRSARRGRRRDRERRARHGGSVPARPDAAPTATARPLRDAFWRGVSRAEFPDRWIGWKPFALAATRGNALRCGARHASSLLARVDRAVRSPNATARCSLWTTATRGPRRRERDGTPRFTPHLLDRHRRVEDACLHDADLVLATSPTICRWLAARATTEPFFAPNFVRPRRSIAAPENLDAGLYGIARLRAQPRARLDPRWRGSPTIRAAASSSSCTRDRWRAGPRPRARLGLAHACGTGYITARESDAWLRARSPRSFWSLPDTSTCFPVSFSRCRLGHADFCSLRRRCRCHDDLPRHAGMASRPGDVDGSSRRSAGLAGSVPTPSTMLRTDHVIDDRRS
jgi:hypothetical protein